jgi:hypothetical protein
MRGRGKAAAAEGEEKRMKTETEINEMIQEEKKFLDYVKNKKTAYSNNCDYEKYGIYLGMQFNAQRRIAVLEDVLA